jgi:hypothetical protein
MRRYILACVALLVLVMLTIPLGAQPAAKDTADPPANTQDKSQLISVNFKGGTIADFVELLKSATPGINWAVYGDLSRIDMPAMDLQNVSVDTAVRLLDKRSQNHDGMSYFVAEASIHRAGQGEQPVVRINVVGRRTGHTEPPVEVQTLVIPVADVLSRGMSADDMLAAIEAALQVSELTDRMRVRFHEPSQILLVRGPENGLEVVHDTTSSLRSVARELQDARIRAEDEEQRGQERDITRLQLMTNDLRSERDAAREQMIVRDIQWDSIQRELDRQRQVADERAAIIDELREEMAARELAASKRLSEMEFECRTKLLEKEREIDTRVHEVQRGWEEHLAEQRKKWQEQRIGWEREMAELRAEREVLRTRLADLQERLNRAEAANDNEPG